MLLELITGLFDLVVPPRPTERVVRSLTIQSLQSLSCEDGLPYHDPRVQALVWELKYRASSRARSLAGEFLAGTLLAIAAEELGVPLLIPVPMHPARRRERGHNQTELLCKAALMALDGTARKKVLGSAFCLNQTIFSNSPATLEYAPHALKRIVDTKTQQGLPRAVRLHNVKNSMQAGRVAEGRVCVVVDDVTTTGATLAECKRALRLAGARAVHTVALARS